ncbi:MAG: B12-binding domain-containing radical SAM protein [Deltaproteobacteria bacterium]|nr:B12-binding domain-containing radical SAM protein [Deltaproteobacteria bacterium]
MPRVSLYCARYNFESIKITPLGISYLAAYLIQQKIVGENEICIVDNLDEVRRFKPDILGVSAVSQVIKDAQDFAKKCKEAFRCFTVLGGYHVSCIPQRLPKEFDIGVLGEGEKTFAEIVYLFKVNELSLESLREIKGICYQKNNEIVTNEQRELFNNLDLLPRPYIHRQYSKEVPIVTSRGCPYRCIFCASRTFWGDKYRLRSADSVVSEIDYLVNKYHPDRINILDDIWMFNKKRFQEIVDKLLKLKIPSKVSFVGFCRSSIIGEEEIALLKKLNYQYLRFGAETGSDILLKRLKGENIFIADHQRVIDLCQKYKIKCGASFMFGVPGETKEDLEMTINFLCKNRGKFIIMGFYFFNPIPGTEIWNWMEKRHMVSENFQFENLQIDFLKENFSWDDLLYFNQDCVSLSEFREFIEKIKAEFIYGRLRKLLGKGLYKYLAKIYHLISEYKISFGKD